MVVRSQAQRELKTDQIKLNNKLNSVLCIIAIFIILDRLFKNESGLLVIFVAVLAGTIFLNNRSIEPRPRTIYDATVNLLDAVKLMVDRSGIFHHSNITSEHRHTPLVTVTGTAQPGIVISTIQPGAANVDTRCIIIL